MEPLQSLPEGLLSNVFLAESSMFLLLLLFIDLSWLLLFHLILCDPSRLSVLWNLEMLGGCLACHALQELQDLQNQANVIQQLDLACTSHPLSPAHLLLGFGTTISSGKAYSWFCSQVSLLGKPGIKHKSAVSNASALYVQDYSYGPWLECLMRLVVKL